VNLAEKIMKSEGFRHKVYIDTRGLPTIGYGHLITKKDKFIEGVSYPEKELRELFYKDLEKAKKGAQKLIWHIKNIDPIAEEIIIEMVYQLGKSGVQKFVKMLLALEELNYHEAHLQMLDSKWHTQTKLRCENLAKMMKECS
tara:strand:+ start:360 stop:785 length:426 start_codon:yes stop_codon:yes gene_type:complete